MVTFPFTKTYPLSDSFKAPKAFCSTNKIVVLLSLIFEPSLTWINFESSYNFNQNYRLSISYGSKRGGVYCSNSICRYIQPFENGFNFEVIALF